VQPSQTRLDRAGIALSILCAIHCLATPLILISLPAAAAHSESAEAWIVAASLLIGVCAIGASQRRNGSPLPRIGISIGLAAIVGSRLLLHGPAETALVFAGAALLVTSHLFNCRECRHGCAHSLPAQRRQSSGILPIVALLAIFGATAPASAAPVEAAPASSVLAAVRLFVGSPYRLGGDSARGIDCSALVQRVFRTLGVEVPRTAAEQFRRGCAVAREELTTGDLVFFHGRRPRSIGHVGIYIGGSRFIHAGLHGVVIASLRSSYWIHRFAGARRLIEVVPAAIVPDPDLCAEGE
jgi:hypothetical protein